MIRVLWTKVIEPWLEAIARDRREGYSAMAIFDVAIGLWIGGCCLLLIILAASGLVVLALNAPIAFVLLALGAVAVVGLGCLIWTLAGDGSNDRATR